MLEYVLIATGFALSAAIQPGPLQAYLLSSVAKTGWLCTLPACLAPLISDGPILLLGATRFLGKRGRRVLVLASAVLLAALGLYQLLASLLGAVAA